MPKHTKQHTKKQSNIQKHKSSKHTSAFRGTVEPYPYANRYFLMYQTTQKHTE